MTTTTTTTTFISIFRVPYIRHIIFNQSLKGCTDQGENTNYNEVLKGRDIIKLARLAMITRYAMPWNFIKHYLPPRDNVLPKRRWHTIARYCFHKNATLSTFEHLLEWSPDFNPQDQVCSYLARNVGHSGHRDILELLIKRYPNIEGLNRAKQAAAEQGHIDVMELLSLYKIENYSSDAMEQASRNGRLDVVMYLHKNGATSSDKAIRCAALGGHFEIVKFLHYNRTEGCDQYTFGAAVYAGNLEIVKFLHFNRSDPTSFGKFTSAATQGHLDVLKFLHENRTEGCNTDAMDRASEKGFIDIVKWLHFNRTEGCTTIAMDSSASLEITQFLHTHRTEGCTSLAMDNAARHNRLDVLKFLHEKRSEGCTSKAIDDLMIFLLPEKRKKEAHSVSMEILTFLHEKLGAVPTKLAVNRAATQGLLEFIQFFHKHYSSLNIWTKAMDYAATKGHLNIVKFLHYNRTEGGTITAMDFASKNGSLNVVVFLHENRTEGASIDAMNRAASGGHLDVVKFLHYNRTEGCSTKAMNGACRGGHLETAKFLYLNRSEGCSKEVLAPTHDCEIIDFLWSNNLISKTQLEQLDHSLNDSIYFETQHHIRQLLRQGKSKFILGPDEI